MKVSAILIVVVLVAASSSSSAHRSKRQGGFLDLSQPRRCTTPLGIPGICINIKKCGSLVELLVQHRHRQEVVSYLRQSLCYYDNNEPVVCCSRVGGGAGDATTSSGRQTVAPTPTPTPDLRPRPTPTPPDPRPQPRPTAEPNAAEDGAYRNPLIPRLDACGVSNRTGFRVVGGMNASLGDWPWMVALGYMSTKTPGRIVYLCGGSIITNRHVLTAAHCVFNRKNLYSARVGDLNLYDDEDNASPVEIRIEESIIHSGYSPTSYVNDIAILRLAEPVTFTRTVQPICLPLSPELRNKNFENTNPFVAGWGTIAFNGPSSNTLQYLQVPVVSETVCRNAFARFKTAVIDERVLCAGYLQGGKDTCKGDSGGPLMAGQVTPRRAIHVQIGVVSFGFKCAEPGYPGVYTRVTAFLDWIIDNVK